MSYSYKENSLVLTQQGKDLILKEWVMEKTTPVYIYDLDDALLRLEKLKSSFSRPVEVHYAVKANGNPQLLKTLFEQGAGADVVSSGEMQWSLQCGVSPKHIVFSGVAKSASEIDQALTQGIFQINVESPEELQRIGERARSLGKTARVAFRMNPDVNPATHPYIKTGFRENKFGMDASFLPDLESILKNFSKELVLQGLALHIGSQIREISSLREAVEKTKAIWTHLKSKGYSLSTFDVGGGLGIDYHDFADAKEMDFIESYGREISEALKDLPEAQILLEPGRILVGRMGMLLCEVQYIKKTPYKTFAIVNTGMHHLMRPALYQAFHRVVPLTKSTQPLQTYDVVGPICESSDVIGRDRRIPELKSGDILAIADSGAYGYSMASSYNMHPVPEEVCFLRGEVL